MSTDETDEYDKNIAVGAKKLREQQARHATFQAALHDMGKAPKSSKVTLRLDLVPQTFIARVAKRFTDGAEKYGEYNYRAGLNSPVFIQDRINHMLNHLHLFLIEGNKNDDNLAALAWGVAMLMEFEEITIGRDSIRKVLESMGNADLRDLYDAAPKEV